jgi:hypothetical protein
VGVNTDGRREVLGVATGPSEAEPFWKAFLRSLADRGLRGVKLVIADDHKGLRAAAAKVFHASHQRCRVHWMRNALAHVPPKQRPAVVAMLKTIFAQESAAAAHEQWCSVADALRERFSKLSELMDASREDVLVYMSFPREHWAQIASTNPLERLNGEIKRRSDVVGIFPNEAAITRLVGAILLEQNDEWAVQRARYMSLVWDVLCQDGSAITCTSFSERGELSLAGHNSRSRRPEGSRFAGARRALQPCIRWVRGDPYHDAGIRIDNQAPGRRSPSGKRLRDHLMYRAATTSGLPGRSASSCLLLSPPDR